MEEEDFDMSKREEERGKEGGSWREREKEESASAFKRSKESLTACYRLQRVLVKWSRTPSSL